MHRLVQAFKDLGKKDEKMGCAGSKPSKQGKRQEQQQQRTRAATGIVSLRDQKLKVGRAGPCVSISLRASMAVDVRLEFETHAHA